MLAAQNWAVIGDVLNSAKPASAVVERLKGAGKTVHLVNPRDSTGSCHKSIGDVDAPLDVIDLIINPRDGLKQMTQAAELGVRQACLCSPQCRGRRTRLVDGLCVASAASHSPACLGK